MTNEEKIKEIEKIIKDYAITKDFKQTFDEEFEKQSISEIKDLLWELVCVMGYIKDTLEEREGDADELN